MKRPGTGCLGRSPAATSAIDAHHDGTSAGSAPEAAPADDALAAIDAELAQHDVPVNPLVARGYLSIGCQPCTEPVAPGSAPRSGRCVGHDRTECNLHL